jgi:hypothetical protein
VTSCLSVFSIGGNLTSSAAPTCSRFQLRHGIFRKVDIITAGHGSSSLFNCHPNTMAPKKRPIETIDLTDDSPFYSSQPQAHGSSSQGYAQSSQSSPNSRAHKQPRTTASRRTPSGASQHDPVYVDVEEDEDEEDVSATQGFTEQEYSWTLYGVMYGKIVGCRYYSGYATVGEMVIVRREPNNAYDSKLILIYLEFVLAQTSPSNHAHADRTKVMPFEF